MSNSRYTEGRRAYLKPIFKKGDLVICLDDNKKLSYVYMIIDYSITNRKRAIGADGQCNNYYVCHLLKDRHGDMLRNINVGIGSTAERMSKVITKEELSAYLL